MAAPPYSRFDYTKQWTGLASQGWDYNDPNINATAQNWYNQQPANVKSKIAPGLKSYNNNLLAAIDWYWRDNQRKSQKENGFFSTLPGKILNTAAQVGLGFVPGVGPALSAGLGAITGGIQGGFSGALLGGLSGYGAGQLGSGLKGAFAGAGGLSTLTKAPGTFFSNVGRNGLTSLQNVVPGYGGSVGSALGSAATSAGGFLSSAARGGTGATASLGGSNMGWFTDILKSAAPDILSSAVSGGISYLGNKSALDSQQQAAQQAQAAAQFRPYNVSGPTGSASFSGTTATGSLSPEMQRMLAQFEGIQGGALSDYNKFNTGNFSQNYYDTIKRYKMPYDQAQTNQLLERVYNTGNWESTTGAKDVYSYEQAKRLEDDMLRIQAQQAGAQEQDRLFDRYFKASSAVEGIRRSPLELITMGGNLGGTAGSINAGAAQYPWLAARNASDASAAFWSNIGTSAGNAASSILSAYNNTRNANRPITYEPSPYFSGGNSTYRFG